MLLNCCTQYVSKFGKLWSGHRTGKGQSVFSPISKKGNAKECSNYHTVALISHASKIMLKILQARLQQYVNQELSDVKNWVWKRQRNQRSNFQHHCWVFQICWHIECNTFTASSFRIWNSSTGISSPLLALFAVMLPKAHLTSYSRMSGSRWVIT